jgi:hypothetical protein
LLVNACHKSEGNGEIKSQKPKIARLYAQFILASEC